MFVNRNLERWHGAGLLDDAARDRIRAWEAVHARPVWLWALAGMGVFAVALGVVALVAANWGGIPGSVKIGGHLTLDSLVAVALFAAWRADRPRTRELLALLLFGLVLSGVALIGQVYQLGGTAWQAMLLWMLVCTPFMLLVTRSGLAALGWQFGAIAAYAVALPSIDMATAHDPVMALAWLPAVALLAFGLGRGLLPGGRVQGRWMEGLAVFGILAAASVPQIVLRLDIGPAVLRPGLGWGLAATLACVPLAVLGRRLHRGHGTASVLLAVAGWATWAVTLGVWDGLHAAGDWAETSSGGTDGAQFAVALVFIAFWGFVSWLALRSGRRNLFAGALAIIMLRVLLFYWEAFGSLLSTGLGLLVGGLVCIGLAALGWQIVRKVPMPAAAQ